MVDLIRGKVARILNSREVVLNVGRSIGVEEGMQFDILDPKAQDITDPDLGVVIGSLNRPKVRVRVNIVEARFSIAQTFRTTRVNVGGTGALDIRLTQLHHFGRALQPPKWVEEPETLRTTEATWEDLDEKESYVKTGDPVVQVPSALAVDPPTSKE